MTPISFNHERGMMGGAQATPGGGPPAGSANWVTPSSVLAPHVQATQSAGSSIALQMTARKGWTPSTTHSRSNPLPGQESFDALVGSGGLQDMTNKTASGEDCPPKDTPSGTTSPGRPPLGTCPPVNNPIEGHGTLIASEGPRARSGDTGGDHKDAWPQKVLGRLASSGRGAQENSSGSCGSSLGAHGNGAQGLDGLFAREAPQPHTRTPASAEELLGLRDAGVTGYESGSLWGRLHKLGWRHDNKGPMGTGDLVYFRPGMLRLRGNPETHKDMFKEMKDVLEWIQQALANSASEALVGEACRTPKRVSKGWVYETSSGCVGRNEEASNAASPDSPPWSPVGVAAGAPGGPTEGQGQISAEIPQWDARGPSEVAALRGAGITGEEGTEWLWVKLTAIGWKTGSVPGCKGTYYLRPGRCGRSAVLNKDFFQTKEMVMRWAGRVLGGGMGQQDPRKEPGNPVSSGGGAVEERQPQDADVKPAAAQAMLEEGDQPMDMDIEPATTQAPRREPTAPASPQFAAEEQGVRLQANTNPAAVQSQKVRRASSPQKAPVHPRPYATAVGCVPPAEHQLATLNKLNSHVGGTEPDSPTSYWSEEDQQTRRGDFEADGGGSRKRKATATPINSSPDRFGPKSASSARSSPRKCSKVQGASSSTAGPGSPVTDMPSPQRVLDWARSTRAELLDAALAAVQLTAPVLELHQRSDEMLLIENYVVDHLQASMGGALYICGPPGTGKSKAVEILRGTVEDIWPSNEVKCIYINGAMLDNKQQIFCQLLQKLGKKNETDPKAAKDKLTRFFHSSLEKGTNMVKLDKLLRVVLILDEMDHLSTNGQAVLLQMFEWAGTQLHPPPSDGRKPYTSRLILVGVANSVDFLQQKLPRIQVGHRYAKPTTVLFEAYQPLQLQRIVQKRLEPLGPWVMEDVAVRFCAQKVANTSGDARAMLELCSNTLAMAKDEQEAAGLGDQIIPSDMTQAMAGTGQVHKALQVYHNQNVQGRIASLPLQVQTLLCATMLMSRELAAEQGSPGGSSRGRQATVAKGMRAGWLDQGALKTMLDKIWRKHFSHETISYSTFLEHLSVLSDYNLIKLEGNGKTRPQDRPVSVLVMECDVKAGLRERPVLKDRL